MGQLLLLRHAKAFPYDPRRPDHSRSLSQEGRDSARRARDAMHALGLVVDVVLVSSARRTMQTLQGLLPWIEPNMVEAMDALYLAPAADLLHVLRQVTPTVRCVLLIGHNPGLHDLAELLCGPEVVPRHFPTAGLAELATPATWAGLGPGKTRLVRFLPPPG